MPASNVVPFPQPARTKPKAVREKLTDKRVRSEPPPLSGSKYIYDTEAGGLALRVTAAGTRTFVLCHRVQGRPERLTLGKFPNLTLDDARKAARAWNGKAARGDDVRAEVKRSRQRGATVADLFKQWHANASTRGLRSLAQDEALWSRWVEPALGSREAQSVTTTEVENLSTRIGARHPRTANLAVALLSRVYALAVKREAQVKNPAKGVARFRERVRDRVLSLDEVQRVFAACESEAEWGDYFRLLLLTGARKAAVAAMRWRDLDLHAATWTVPSWASKNGKPLALALVQSAVELLQTRAEMGLSADWVFPSPTSKSGHVETPKRPWQRVCAKAGLQGVVIHDLRRTLGTMLAVGGASGHVISAALGHLSRRSADVYVHLGTDAVRDHLTAATQRWGKG